MRKEFGKNGGKERPMSEALVTVQISFIHDRLCAIVKPVQLMCRMKRSAGWMANDTRTNETHSIRTEKVCYGSFFSRSSLLLARLPNLVFMIHGLCTVGFVACSLAYLLAVVKRLNWHIDLYKHHNRLTMKKKTANYSLLSCRWVLPSVSVCTDQYMKKAKTILFETWNSNGTP